MVKTSTHKITTMTVHVKVTEEDIEGGVCRKPSLCMEKVAIARALDADGGSKVWIDGGVIRFHLGGYRWEAITPKIAKHNLIIFDKEKPVRPHSYKFVATRKTKIVKIPKERQEQINEARRRRLSDGKRDKPAAKYTLRDRVVGLA